MRVMEVTHSKYSSTLECDLLREKICRKTGGIHMNKMYAKILLVIVGIILLVAAVLALGFTISVGGILLGAAAVSALLWTALGIFVLAILVDPDEVNANISRVSEVFAKTTEEIGKAAGDFVSGLFEGLGLRNILLYGGIAFFGYRLLSNDRSS